MARTNEALNKAIWTVLTTQFKKQAPEAFKMVQENGYQVEKNGCGTWTVSNPHTKRHIHIEYGRYYCRTTLVYGYYTTQSRTWKDAAEERIVATQFDFVNCLKTYQNDEYYTMRSMKNADSKAKQQYDRIKSVKYSIGYEQKEIERIQKQLVQLQSSLAYHIEQKVKDEQRLVNVRKEFGLVK